MGKSRRAKQLKVNGHSLALRRTDSVEVEDAAAGLAVAEYSSVRAESLQSFATSQSIIQWSLATYGVLFGAGLLAANNQIDKDLAPTVWWMAAVIYGALLPGLVCAAAWSWIGEIRRMERTGAFLRGLEQHLREETLRGTASVVGPLNWESFLAGDPTVRNSSGKGWAPYLGTAMLFGGSIITSMIFFFFWMDRILSKNAWTDGAGLLIGIATTIVVIFVVVCIHTGIGVVYLGQESYDLPTRTMRSNGSRSRRFYTLIEITLIVLLLAAGLFIAFWFLPDTLLSWRGDLLVGRVD